MISLIPAVLSAIPSIINLFTGDTSRTESVKELAVQAGKALGLGEEASASDVVSHLSSNPDAVIKLKEIEASAKEVELRHLREVAEEANRTEETKRKMAHETYQQKNAMQDEIAKQIIQRNLPIIAILVAVNIALVYFLKENASLIAIASNIIGVAIGNLFNERQAIINFFFGSSIGSKEKQEKLTDIAMVGKLAQ